MHISQVTKSFPMFSGVGFMLSFLIIIHRIIFSVLLSWFQVLLHKSFLHCFCYDLLFYVWCSGVLAYITLLLDCSVCPYDEAPNCTHDQIQVYSIQHWEAGEIRMVIVILVYFGKTALKPFYLSLATVAVGATDLKIDFWCLKINLIFNLWQKYGGKKASASSSGSRGDWCSSKFMIRANLNLPDC